MKTVTVRLDEETRAVFLRSEITGCNLKLPEQLPRVLYLKVAKAIEAAGGKWNRKANCHVFPRDVRDTLDVKMDTVEVVNLQQTYQAFYTPEDVAQRMAVLADVAGKTVLEPSAGTGRLVQACARAGARSVKCIDIDPKMVAKLAAEMVGKLAADGLTGVYCADFMECNPILKYERIVMNPPFTRGQDIQHIRHALLFLKEGGRLVAIIGAGPKQREAFQNSCDEWIDLPAGTFAESGTNVATAIIVINK